VIALSFALAGVFAVLVVGYPLANRPLTRADDGPIVERARRDAGAVFRDAGAHGRSTFPIVLRLVDRTCVDLRSWATDGAGSYTVCYDVRSGRKLSEQVNTGF
jgi:hypothetical protein